MPPPENPNTCAICMTPVGEAEAAIECPACHAKYHAECWQENGGCAVYGCTQVPKVEARQSIEIPVSYWGQEKKPCPSCGREILAAALRCRHCGAMFESARPQGQEEFRQRTERDQQLPAARRFVLWIFILSITPCLAPAGVIWGLVWNSSHRDEIDALPSVYPALSKIGLVIGIVETVLMVVVSILFAAFRAS